MSNEFKEFCTSYGIKRELSAPYTPQQNGVAKRTNRSVIEMTRSMVRSKSLKISVRAEAVSTVIYLVNISPTRALKISLHFRHGGFKPTVKHLKVFGSATYTLILSVSLQTFDAKSEKCILIGYCNESKAYKLYNSLSKEITIS